jgi:predicted ArsR family transcriptional regulator
MARSTLTARFLDSTRGRIVNLLRRSSHTVDELADELGITDNAVRLHLGTLERDAIVRAAGVRREGAVGKPATVYEIHPSADASFSNAYVPFLSAVLGALSDKLSTRDLRALMRDVGRRLAGGSSTKATKSDGGSLAARAEAASRALNDLGGVTVVELAEVGRGLVIRGHGCPLSAASGSHEEVCLAVQTLVTEMTAAEVRERCDRSGDRPCCCFEVS